MPNNYQADLDRWQAAGVLTPAAAEAIRQFEAGESQGGPRLRWPVLIALGAGGLMLGAGVLLFVSAQWGGMSQAAQFVLVLLLVGLFHLAAALVVDRFEALASAFHALGTAALGAGIFLAARIFNLESSWPNGVLLWAAGAGIAWYLRREWSQAVFVALLAPIWLVGQWLDSASRFSFDREAAPFAGMLLLALAYLWTESPEQDSSTRRLLTVLGTIAVLPLGIAVGLMADHRAWGAGPLTSVAVDVAGWLLFLGVPLIVGWGFRRREAWPLLVAALWVKLGTMLPSHADLLPFIWGAVGALGLTAAGVADRSRIRVNLGVIAFALTTLLFYFSSVMDKLGRSASLMVGGALFLAGGWGLERLRRRLVAAVSAPVTPA